MSRIPYGLPAASRESTLGLGSIWTRPRVSFAYCNGVFMAWLVYWKGHGWISFDMEY